MSVISHVLPTERNRCTPLCNTYLAFHYQAVMHKFPDLADSVASQAYIGTYLLTDTCVTSTYIYVCVTFRIIWVYIYVYVHIDMHMCNVFVSVWLAGWLAAFLSACL